MGEFFLFKRMSNENSHKIINFQHVYYKNVYYKKQGRKKKPKRKLQKARKKSKGEIRLRNGSYLQALD